MDVFFLVIVCVFFALAIAYVFGCESLLGGGDHE